MLSTFQAFSKFGDSKSNGTELSNKQFSKLCKDTGIIGKLVTSTDVDICFSKHKPLVFSCRPTLIATNQIIFIAYSYRFQTINWSNQYVILFSGHNLF